MDGALRFRQHSVAATAECGFRFGRSYGIRFNFGRSPGYGAGGCKPQGSSRQSPRWWRPGRSGDRLGDNRHRVMTLWLFALTPIMRANYSCASMSVMAIWFVFSRSWASSLDFFLRFKTARLNPIEALYYE